jgi:aspartate 1-decarboxylase
MSTSVVLIGKILRYVTRFEILHFYICIIGRAAQVCQFIDLVVILAFSAQLETFGIEKS